MAAMSGSTNLVTAERAPRVTRFAPSPTGELHLGNARTALFNLLLARHANGGRLLLRIEDTDAERSREVHTSALLEDLRWLGIEWDAGPDREDERGPYRQSQRGELYRRYLEVLEARQAVYPCFCTPLELELSRRAQLAAGKPPRYAGTCRDLDAAERTRRAQQGAATLRFKVPHGVRIEFVDFVRGPQSFQSDDIGDFVVRRADGSAAFFFSNAVDDACMGVTHALRGEDHLTNTPRQLLILSALELAAPSYGHMALIVGADGAPLSKRHGAVSLREYRERGYQPLALANHLFRLGHSSSEHGLITLAEMARVFDPAHLGRSPARFDEQQLRVWQKDSVHRLSPDAARSWLKAVMPAGLETGAASAFITAVLPNLVLPEDARAWVEIVFGGPPALAAAGEELVRGAGAGYFAAAAAVAASRGDDLPAIAAAARAASGRKGAALYMPLRLALTGRTDGPELAPLLKALPPGTARERLARFA
jgi:nondiscriminating glutamyl-tRNA synthetase